MSLSSILKPNSLHLFGAELTPGSDSNKYLYFDSINNALAISVDGVEVQYNTNGSTVVIKLVTNTGSSLLPSYTFTGHMDSGMYYDTLNNTIAFSLSGVKVFDITGSGIVQSRYLADNGSSSLPSFTFTNKPDTGVYYDSVAGSLSISVNGAEVQSNTSTHSEFIKIYNGDGSNTAPSYTFATSTNTGIYLNSGIMSFANSGTTIMTIDTSKVNATRYIASIGSVSSPAYAFNTALNTGMFYDTGLLEFSNNGSSILTVDGSKISTTRIVVNNSDQNNPGIGFAGSNDTGLFYDSVANSLAVTVTGVEIMDIKNTGMRLFNNTVDYSASILNYYENLTQTFVWDATGVITPPSNDGYITKIGSNVTISFIGVNIGLPVDVPNITSTSLPPRFIPKTTDIWSFLIPYSGSPSIYKLTIDGTSGVIAIVNLDGSNIAAGTYQFLNFSISYVSR